RWWWSLARRYLPAEPRLDRRAVRGRVLRLRQGHHVVGDVGQRVPAVVDDVDAPQEGLDGQARGVAGAAAGGQDVGGAGRVVAEGDGGPGADENRARVAHAFGDRGGVGGLDLQVLGGVGVDHAQALVDAVDEDGGGLLAGQGRHDPVVDVLGGGDLPGELLVDGVGELDGVGDQDGRGQRVVLGLADQVGGDVHRVG